MSTELEDFSITSFFRVFPVIFSGLPQTSGQITYSPQSLVYHEWGYIFMGKTHFFRVKLKS